MRFIAHAQDPQSQVELFKMFGNGPANPAAAALIPADRRHLNCTDPDNLPKQGTRSAQYPGVPLQSP